MAVAKQTSSASWPWRNYFYMEFHRMLVTESMKKETEGFIRNRNHGQGKSVMTVQADQGDFVHLVTDAPFRKRNRPGKLVSDVGPRGSRPMHKTTFAMNQGSATEYMTTNQNLIFGRRALLPAEVAYPYPSQHTSQFDLDHPGALDWNSNYHFEFIDKGSDAPLKLHMPSIKNGLNMREGRATKELLTFQKEPSSFNTEYSRIHDKLGVLRGPGVPRERPVRQALNVLTGEKIGPAWSETNRRTSGNRILYNDFGRRTERSPFSLG